MYVLDMREVRWALQDAAESYDLTGAGPGQDEPVIRLLGEQWARGAPVAEVAEELLSGALGAARARGWSRAELVLASGPAGPFALDLIDYFITQGGEACAGCWAERASLCIYDATATIVAALAMLSRIPQRPPATPAPKPQPSTIDPKVLGRVRALLAKAESTTFPDEAEALMAKAQELMARHAIDRAMVGRSDGTEPSSVRILVEDPYATAKSVLLGAVAHATRCQAVWSKRSKVMTVFGYPDDLAAVELLYTSLLLQATAALSAAGRDGDARSRSRAFRHAFLVAFANRIGRRLAEVTAATVQDADREHEGSLLPVLARREAAIDAAVAEAFPRLGRSRTSASDASGWAAGVTAADRAALGGDAVGSADARRLGPG
jgi:hypothetical protein